MPTLLWIVLHQIALALLGMTTVRDGHTVLFCFGFPFSVPGILDALTAPTPAWRQMRERNSASRLLGAGLAALGDDANRDRPVVA